MSDPSYTQVEYQTHLSDLISLDSGLVPGATYEYQLRASGPGGDRYSNPVSGIASTVCAEIPFPLGITVNPVNIFCNIAG